MGKNLRRSVADAWEDDGWNGQRSKRRAEAKREAKARKNEDLANFRKEDWDSIVEEENRF